MFSAQKDTHVKSMKVSIYDDKHLYRKKYDDQHVMHIHIEVDSLPFWSLIS
jgi:hypothetical protein